MDRIYRHFEGVIATLNELNCAVPIETFLRTFFSLPYMGHYFIGHWITNSLVLHQPEPSRYIVALCLEELLEQWYAKFGYNFNSQFKIVIQPEEILPLIESLDLPKFSISPSDYLAILEN
jgi:hypothetical protein